MKTLAMFNCLIALNSLSGVVLKDVKISRNSGGWGRDPAPTYHGCTKQAVKIAIGIADSSYPTIKNAIKFIPEFIQSGRNYAEFHALICKDQLGNIDPIKGAQALLNRG
jgi:hypothetical protein